MSNRYRPPKREAAPQPSQVWVCGARHSGTQAVPLHHLHVAPQASLHPCSLLAVTFRSCRPARICCRLSVWAGLLACLDGAPGRATLNAMLRLHLEALLADRHPSLQLLGRRPVCICW
jgi:hypothetical protein